MSKYLKTSVSLDEETLKWIDKMIEEHIFSSRSHAVQLALFRLRKEMEGAGKEK